MRIAHVANFYGPRSGGIRTTMNALTAGYAAAGHEVHLVVPGPRDAWEPVPGGTLHTVAAPMVPRTGGYRMITRPDAVRSLLDGLEPDRIEVSDRTTLLGLGDWARARGVPSILMVHERIDGVLRAFTPDPFDGLLPPLAERWNRRSVARFDRVVATTEYAAAEVERLGLDVPVHRVPLGVDLGLFRPSAATERRRRSLAGEYEALVVVASRLSAEKRVDLAVDAVARLVHDGTPARLVVAGGGQHLPRLRRRAERAGVPHRFMAFVPDRERLAGVLACADVVVAPGPIETFGLAALEALACGTPVVVSRTSALPEVVGDAGAAPAPEPAAIAAAVREVLDRPVATRRAAARARAELFPWSLTVERMLALHGAPVLPSARRGAATHRAARSGVRAGA
ncbi:glycosyltransferase [Paraoerskovia sediminicola]|uniref:glycosyltransferase n=1 Tax=Paraoerskovia sediminicola TaxID=1138587 RepID=UPI0025733410|nr:glycosyltransferase [Paraoerskovia sediminicola]